MVDHGLSPMPDWSASKEGPEWERLASVSLFLIKKSDQAAR